MTEPIRRTHTYPCHAAPALRRPTHPTPHDTQLTDCPHLFELAEDFERVAEIAAGFSLSHFVLDLAGYLKVEFVVFKGLGVFLEIKVGVAQLTARRMEWKMMGNTMMPLIYAEALTSIFVDLFRRALSRYIAVCSNNTIVLICPY